MYVELNNDMTEENIRQATQTINQNIDQAPKYPGIDIQTTGTPVMRNVLSDVLVEDTVKNNCNSLRFNSRTSYGC